MRGPWARRRIGIAAGPTLAAWLAAAYALGASAVLASAPGRAFRPVLLTILVPLGVFLAVLARSARVRRFVLARDLVVLTQLQQWRVVGFGFLLLYGHGVLPGLFAFPAGLGDVAVGLAAPLVAARLAARPGFARSRSFIAFHLLGTVDFAVAAATATLASGAFPGVHAGPVTAAPMEVWPLILFPSLFVPLFLFLHIAALLQVRARRAGTG